MKYQISAQTRLEPGITQVLLPELSELDSRLEFVEAKESEYDKLKEEKEYYEYKMTSGKIADAVAGYFTGGMVGGFAGLMMGTAFNSMGFFIVGVFAGAILFGILFRKNRKKKYGKKAAHTEDLMEQKYSEYAPIKAQLESRFGYIPPAFMFSYAIEKLIDIIRYNRADSWMSALNLLEQSLRLDRMEINQAIHNQQMEQEMQEAKAAATGAAISSGLSLVGRLIR